MKPNSLKRLIAVALVAAVTAAPTGRAHAMLAPVDAPGMMSERRDAEIKNIQTFLEQKQVSEKLAEYGFTSGEIKSRLGALTAAEIHRISTRIDQQNPAGDGAGVIVTVLVIGILALLFVYLFKRV